MPISGEFTIDFKPEKEGDYEVTVLATPAPLSLPVIGVFPVTGKSDVMKIAVGERPPAVFRFSGVKIDEHDVPLTNPPLMRKPERRWRMPLPLICQ